MDNITALGGDVYEIDTRMAGYSGITAGYLILGDRPCLVETGTSTSAPVVRDALAALGVGPEDLATVVVTHIHLDHAGGVGDIAGFYPEAEIVVHEKGARHLADPSRSDVQRPDGLGRPDWTPCSANSSPTEAARIRALGDTGAIDLGNGRTLSSHYSPGHAKHHVGLIDSGTGDLYVGDAAGVYLPQTGDLRPATPAAGLRPADRAGLDRPVRGAGPAAAALQPLRTGHGRGGDPGALRGGAAHLGRPDPSGPLAGHGPGPRGSHGQGTHPRTLRGAESRRGHRRAV